MDRIFIDTLIEKHEGRRATVYADTAGKATIGVGWNLDDPSAALIAFHFGLDLTELKNGTAALTDGEIDEIKDYQIGVVIRQAMSIFDNFMEMPDGVQAAIVDMLFNLGETRFTKFVSTIGQLKAGDYTQAGIEAGNSLWAKQVPNRAADDIKLLYEAS